MRPMRRFVVLILLLGLMLALLYSAQAESILPVLTTPKPDVVTAPSLHSATALDPDKLTVTPENGLALSYTNVSNECYEAFGVALSQDGYTLTGSETGDEGALTLTVSNGSVTLTLLYQPQEKKMTVTYPPQVEPRDTERYGSYTELHDGDTFPVADGVTATVAGWQPVDAWTELYYSSMYMIKSRTSNHETDADKQQVLVTLTLSNGGILPLEINTQLVNLKAAWADGTADYPYFGASGNYSGLPSVNVRSEAHGGVMLAPKADGEAAIGISCKREGRTAEDTLALTFTAPNRTVRYVYFLKPLSGI
ncbi:MAG: hypothetical protein GX418_09335 [Clostridiales bacterium]|nr:hypothetical protein [Clostridiales bacterium]